MSCSSSWSRGSGGAPSSSATISCATSHSPPVPPDLGTDLSAMFDKTSTLCLHIYTGI